MASRRDRKFESDLSLDDGELERLLESAGPRPPLPAEDLDAIAAATRGAWESRPGARPPARGRRRALWPLAAMAAALAALVLAAVWWRAQRFEGSPPRIAEVEAVTGTVVLETAGAAALPLQVGDPIPSGAVVRTLSPEGGAGEDDAGGALIGPGETEGGDAPRVALRLATGVVLRLDQRSSLRLASESALELMAGAVYADTDAAPGPIAALEVSTPMGRARDLGTRFAVRLLGRPPELELHVLVRDGAVAVDREDGRWVAAAGQELVLRQSGGVERRLVSGFGPEWDWVVAAGSGFEIGGRTPRDLLDWISRESGWKVRFEDETVEQMARTIPFEAGDDSAVTVARPEQGLRVLPSAGLEGESRDGVLLVRRLRR